MNYLVKNDLRTDFASKKLINAVMIVLLELSSI